MKRVILTNNKKVLEELKGKAEVTYLEGATPIDILEDAKAMAEKGGKLLQNPVTVPARHYYRSVPLLLDEMGTRQEHSIAMLDACLKKIGGNRADFAREPMLAGIMQNKDVENMKKLLG